MKLFWFFFLFSSFTIGQSFEPYFQLLEDGNIKAVKDQLPELKSKYPYNPTLTYLQLLMSDDGDSTVDRFKYFLKQYPDSEYADGAEMKIGEYLYSRGLYEQSGRQFKKIPLMYPKSEHIQRAVDLMVLSFNATGESDSVQYYLAKYKWKFPQLEVKQYNVNLEKAELKQDNQFDKKTKTDVINPGSHPWVVQLGAFGKYSNAKRLKNIVSGLEYPIEIVEVMSNGKRLHAVRVVRFKTREEAERIGREVKTKYGVNFRVLKRS
ncbi:MAG: SPOR domain-containing protein [Fidelibacterota bacterium]